MRVIHLLVVALIGCATGLASGLVATTSTDTPALTTERDGQHVTNERWYQRWLGWKQVDEPWQSYEVARARAIERGRPLLVVIKMHGCAPCELMQGAIEQLHENGALSRYEVALINISDSRRDWELAMRLTGMQLARGVPQLVLYAPHAQPPTWTVRRHVGALTADELMEFLAG